jgi:hypothetical protein
MPLGSARRPGEQPPRPAVGPGAWGLSPKPYVTRGRDSHPGRRGRQVVAVCLGIMVIAAGATALALALPGSPPHSPSSLPGIHSPGRHASIHSPGRHAGIGSPASHTGSHPPCQPIIASVSPFAATQYQTVTIRGSCLGTSPRQQGGDTPNLQITDLSADWNGCYDGGNNVDLDGCYINSWTDTSIIFGGFDTSVSLSGGDHLRIMVWNPETTAGPAFCSVTVGEVGTTIC